MWDYTSNQSFYDEVEAVDANDMNKYRYSAEMAHGETEATKRFLKSATGSDGSFDFIRNHFDRGYDLGPLRDNEIDNQHEYEYGTENCHRCGVRMIPFNAWHLSCCDKCSEDMFNESRGIKSNAMDNMEEITLKPQRLEC